MRDHNLFSKRHVNLDEITSLIVITSKILNDLNLAQENVHQLKIELRIATALS